jgi:hypothetical protein
VDFVIEVGDEVVLAAQVKSSAQPGSHEVFPGEAETVFGRLRPSGTTRAMLIANRRRRRV